MYHRKTIAITIALLLALALLAGCAGAPSQTQPTEAPAPAPEAEPAPADETPDDGVIRVSTAEEFMAAVAPGVTVELAEGEYILPSPDRAGDVTEYCRWIETWDGCELEIHDAPGLTVRGAGADKTVISALPRYANVLIFRNCGGLTVVDLTAGHTREPGLCTGGVLRLIECHDSVITGCGLFGCGTVGVQAEGCGGLTVADTKIYECSWNAVAATGCSVVEVTGCEVYDCGAKGDWIAYSMFDVCDTDSFTVTGTTVHNNLSQSLLTASGAKSVKFLSNTVSDNRFDGAVFGLSRSAAVVDGCALGGNSFARWSEALRPVDAEGNTLTNAALEGMTLREIDPESIAAAPMGQATEVAPGGEIRVTTVDEFLAAIGPERTVILAPGVYDLSTASQYGGPGGEYYAWEESYDGPQLVIQGVDGLTILAESHQEPRDTEITAVPRYANVLAFRNCSGLALAGFTAGHSEGYGECSGGVIYLQDCGSVTIDRCRLYGCGVEGVYAWDTSILAVRDCEIYDCSWCAAYLYGVESVGFSGCDIHDVPSPALHFDGCVSRYWNDEPIDDGMYDVLPDGSLDRYYSPGADDEPYADALFMEDSPELRFALRTQTALALADWDALAELTSFPLRIYTAGGTFVFPDKASLTDERMAEMLSGDFRRAAATAPLYSYRHTSFGSVFADGALAFVYVAAADGMEPKLSAISTMWNLG